MHAAELERYLTEFLGHSRNAKTRFEKAVEEEQFPNDATQDLLHVIELAPSQLKDVDIVKVLHELRVARRDTKRELEVTRIYADWATQNKKALDTLEQCLGQMRKILRRQPNDAYRYKTGVIGEKGAWLVADPEPKPEPEFEQEVLDGFS